MEAKANSLWKFKIFEAKSFMQVSYEVGSSRSEQEISTRKRITFVTCQRFLSNYKNASFVLNCTEFLQSLISSRKTIRTTPTFNSRSKMINSQWKALHLGRWELLFKIMDEGSITRVADIENLQRSQLSRMVQDWKKS